MSRYVNIIAFLVSFCLLSTSLYAQQVDSANQIKPKGTVWGNAFFDYVFKAHADTVALGRGGSNQYSKIPVNSSFMQIRRVYLGYNYDIFPRLSAEFLLAVEDDYSPGSVGNQTSTGDVLNDNKIAPYLKLANIKWKNLFPGTDLVMGEALTPAYPFLTEVVWGYRSVERTITDIRRTPSFDKGIELQGHYGKDNNYGYNLMVGNGNGAKPENDNFKWYYGDVWLKLFDKKLIIDLYQDYNRITWNVVIPGQPNQYHHDRNTTKLFIAYTVPKFTVGVEMFQTTLMNDVIAYTRDSTFYKTTFATGISLYGRGRLYKDKLGFFVRYDNYNPGNKIGDITANKKFLAYSASTTQYDPTTKEQFITAGLDFTPFPNLHLIPNIWLNTYTCTLPKEFDFLNPKGTTTVGTDLAYRVTVFYIFGKNDAVRY